MKNNKEMSIILSTALIFFFLMESFYNIMINTNAYVFTHLSDILIILPGLLITILIVVFEILVFMSSKIIKKYRLYLLIYIICGTRIISQFIIAPAVIFIFNFILFFSTLLFFIELILFMDNYESFNDYSLFLGGIIIGLGIQFIFLTINVSTNVTADMSKLIPTFLFSGLLIFINFNLFHPKKFETYQLIENNNANDFVKKEISLLHFIILGVIFLLAMMWLINPMAISSYDVLNLSYNGLIPYSVINWPSYGFTYYIILILIVAMVTYFIWHKKLLSLEQKTLKKIVLSSIGISCVLNFLAILIVENDYTFLSTFYISLLTTCNVFSLIAYISYIFYFYSFSSKRKLYMGLLLFFITAFFFIILHVEVLWDYHLSLIVFVLILTTTASGLIFLTEFKNLNIKLKQKKIQWNWSKPIGISFIIIIIINMISFGVIIQARLTAPEQNNNPTIMTWNIHNGIGVDDVFDLDRLIEDIKLYDPDIIGLNEVDMGALKTSFADLTSYFAQELNMYYFYGFSFYKHYGNAILSKYPIKVAEIIHLPLAVQFAEPRSMIRAKIEINSKIWTIFITHLSVKKDDRLAQIPFIVNEIDKEIDFERIVWLGDFNFDPYSKEYSLIDSSSNLRFRDTYTYVHSDRGYTGNFDDNFNPRRRIDYIMCSPDLVPTSSVIHWSLASDHCALITKFKG